MKNGNNNMKKVAVFVCMTAFLFGTMEVALKLAGTDMDNLQLTFLRFFVGGLLLLPFAVAELKREHIRIGKKDLAYLVYLGVLCIPVSMLAFQVGVMNSNASTASVIMSLNPLFTMIFAHFMTEEKFTKKKAVVLAIGMVGLLFMVRPWDIQGGNTFYGIFMMIVAASTFALYTVSAKKCIKTIGIMAQTSISFIIGSLVLLVIMLIMGRPVMEGVVENWKLILYISIFVTGMGYYFYFMAIKYSDAATGSLAFFIKPAIAPVMAVIVLHETILWNTYLGIALVLAASFYNMAVKKPSAPKAS